MFEEPQEKKSCLFVIFGATGDLTHNKLLPALYRLQKEEDLCDNFAVVGVSRRDKSHEEYRKDAEKSIKKKVKKIDKKIWKKLASKLYYYKNNFKSEEDFPGLKEFLGQLDEKHNTKGNRVFYLATLPSFFGSIVDNLKEHKFVDRESKSTYKIVIEKPFGNDFNSAKKLNDILKSLFREEEIFRIDHFLAKEAVQNIFAFRFANRMFDAVWNHHHIDHVQITVAEDKGVEDRGNFYDDYGALKDMVQNHLLQTLSIVAMDPPKKFEIDKVKNEKVKVLKSVKIKKKNVVFGQYENYRKTEGVEDDSRTETYVALKLNINNKRWKKVPFYLRTGKNLKRKASEVVLQFKDTELNGFSELPNTLPNVLVIRLQPEEGIYLRFNAKQPGNEFKFQEVSMDFCHECLFGFNTPEAYQKLLFDAFQGDKTLFTRWDEVANAWKIVDPIAKNQEAGEEKPETYKVKSWGPEKADNLIKKDAREWRKPL